MIVELDSPEALEGCVLRYLTSRRLIKSEFLGRKIRMMGY